MGSVPVRGAHAPAEARRNGVGGASSPAPPCPRCGPWERGGGGGGAAVWGRGGSGRGSPGRAAEGWKEGAGAGAARLETTPVGMPGSPPCSRLPLHTLTRTPRRAGVDVSLKASHLHSEGRGLAEAADRGSRSPRCPHLRRPRASERRRPRPVSRPHPGSPLRAVMPSPPRWRGPSWPASRARPRPPPAPLRGARSPMAAKLHFAFLEPAFLGAPSPFAPPSVASPLSLHPLLSSSPAKPAE